MRWLINAVMKWGDGRQFFRHGPSRNQRKLYTFFSPQQWGKTDQQHHVEESICSHFGYSQRTCSDASANLSIYTSYLHFSSTCAMQKGTGS